MPSAVAPAVMLLREASQTHPRAAIGSSIENGNRKPLVNHGYLYIASKRRRSQRG